MSKAVFVKVKDMPSDVRHACMERGYSYHDELSPEGAMREWAGWHLGDPEWASSIIYHYNELHEFAKARGES